MIAFYRRIPHFTSKNVRTLFRDAVRLSPVDTWLKKVLPNCKNGVTNEGHKYQMLRVRENVQVLLISNPNKKDKDMVSSAIGIGVGSEEDPNDCLGLAHLQEHIISSMAVDSHLNQNSYCETKSFQTVYSFETFLEDYPKVMKIWTELLFSADDLETMGNDDIKEIVRTERERVDNEFHESRTINKLDVAIEILKSESINLCKFGFGNRDTLDSNVDVLLKKLNKSRKLHCQRPVVICVYSGCELDMKTVLKSMSINTFVQTDPPTEARPIDWEKRLKSSKDFDKHFIVVRSDDDWIKLDILFPQFELSFKQSNTFRFICEMIRSPTVGFLSDYLLERELATDCTAVVESDIFAIVLILTPEGSKQIKEVRQLVQTYLHFLHDQWMQLEEHNFRKVSKDLALTNFKSLDDLQYARHIATHLDGKADSFNEVDLFEELDRNDEKYLISKHILHNKNIVHKIAHPNPQQVIDAVAKSPNTAEPHVEPLFGDQFYIVETEPFKFMDPKRVRLAFFIEPERLILTSERKYFVLMDARMNAAFQSLFVVNFEFKIRDCCSAYDPPRFSVYPEMVSYTARNASNTSFLDDFESMTMDIQDFPVYKEHLMRGLSSEMNDSKTFAKSLIETTLINIHVENLSEPVPMQYNTLLTMTRNEYLHRVESFRVEENGKKIPEINPDVLFDETFSITSINANESITATFIFLQIHQEGRHDGISTLLGILARKSYEFRKKYELYTARCSVEQCLGISGILFEVISVEQKDGQSSEDILQMCYKYWHDIAEEIKKHKNYEKKKLQELFDSMVDRRITVQIIGNKKPQLNEDTFRNRFGEWFKKHETEFEKTITNPSLKYSID